MTAMPLLRVTPSTDGPIGRLMSLLGRMGRWQRAMLALLLGAFAALALPPIGALPVLLLSIPGLIWQLDTARTGRQAFAIGWCWGLGWFLAGLYWIANALLLEPDKFGWMVPFATLGLSSVLAVFTGLATGAAHYVRAPGLWRVSALAACWTITEWMRSWVLTGFPWNPLGSVWDVSLPVLQAGSTIGVFGLSLLTIQFFGLLVVIGDLRPRKFKRYTVLTGMGAFALLSALGLARLASHDRSDQPDIQLRLVQASVDQRIKGRSNYREQQLFEQINLTHSLGWDKVTHVVWAETAAPFFLDLDEAHRQTAALAAPPNGLLLTGAPRLTPPEVQPYQLWNSLMAITHDAQIAGLFDKAHLVPFGEYVPMRSLLKIPKITLGGTDFSSGPGPVTLQLPNTPPVSPLICYEGIFPGAIVNRDHPRPDWLLTITNDGWFGISTGPYQHLAAGRMRAIEEGLPLVRAANTGISAIIDPLGRIITSLDLGQRGVVDGPLPKPVAPTLFSRFGNLIPLALAGILLLLCAWQRQRYPSNPTAV